MTVASEAPPRASQAAGWVGHTVPAYAGSAGRALLFDRTRAEVGSLLAGTTFRRLAPETPRGVDRLWRLIESARRVGYAVAVDELEPGLLGVAAPVRDFTGRTVAAVNVSGPRYRFEERVGEAGALVRGIASRLSARLGEQAA